MKNQKTTIEAKGDCREPSCREIGDRPQNSLAVFFPPAAVAAGSAGVFAGGVAWSWLYVRYGSIWPGYLSHAIVDVAVFGAGAALLFG